MTGRKYKETSKFADNMHQEFFVSVNDSEDRLCYLNKLKINL